MNSERLAIAYRVLLPTNIGSSSSSIRDKFIDELFMLYKNLPDSGNTDSLTTVVRESRSKLTYKIATKSINEYLESTGKNPDSLDRDFLQDSIVNLTRSLKWGPRSSSGRYHLLRMTDRIPIEVSEVPKKVFYYGTISLTTRAKNHFHTKFNLMEVDQIPEADIIVLGLIYKYQKGFSPIHEPKGLPLSSERSMIFFSEEYVSRDLFYSTPSKTKDLITEVDEDSIVGILGDSTLEGFKLACSLLRFNSCKSISRELGYFIICKYINLLRVNKNIYSEIPKSDIKYIHDNLINLLPLELLPILGFNFKNKEVTSELELVTLPILSDEGMNFHIIVLRVNDRDKLDSSPYLILPTDLDMKYFKKLFELEVDTKLSLFRDISDINDFNFTYKATLDRLPELEWGGINLNSKVAPSPKIYTLKISVCGLFGDKKVLPGGAFPSNSVGFGIKFEFVWSDLEGKLKLGRTRMYASLSGLLLDMDDIITRPWALRGALPLFIALRKDLITVTDNLDTQYSNLVKSFDHIIGSSELEELDDYDYLAVKLEECIRREFQYNLFPAYHKLIQKYN